MLEHLSLDGHGPVALSLDGMNLESHPFSTVSFELAKVEGVQGRRAGSGVNFCLDVLDPEVRETDPFSPADHGKCTFNALRHNQPFRHTKASRPPARSPISSSAAGYPRAQPSSGMFHREAAGSKFIP